MQSLIGNLCHRPEGGVDHDLYEKLHTTMPLDEALDLAEIDEVGRSWRDAALANSETPDPHAPVAAKRRRRR